MKHLGINSLAIITFCSLITLPLSAQIKLIGSNYLENFNTLVKTGNSNILPTGWLLEESGTNANGLYTASNGTANSGDTYSFGVIDEEDRSLGCLQSGSLISTLGVGFTNATSSSFSGLKVTYTGEQWRLGALNRIDRLDFQISFDATNLSNGTWKDIDSLDLIAPVKAGAVGPLNGNLPENKVLLTYLIKDLNIEPGQKFYLRWKDFNATGADDALGIEDFKMEAILGASTNENPTILSLFPKNMAKGVNVTSSFSIAFSKTIKIGSGNILIRKSDTREIASVIPSGQINIAGNSASFQVGNLKLSTTYDVEIPAGLFSDVSGNTFPGINIKEIWYFTTNDWPIYEYSFNKCSPLLIDEWQVANLLGDSTWRCTSDGYPSNNGVVINGFTPGIGGRDNNDWLISPSLDLSLYTNPSLAFAIKSRFKGMPLKVYIAVNQASRPEPGSNNWKELEVIYPTLRDENWRQIASLDITKYKSANTYIAFQYLSNIEKGASQLFLDEVKIINLMSQAKPIGVLHSLNLITFDKAKPNVATDGKEINYQILNLTSNIVIKASSYFEISRDNKTFSTEISINPEELSVILPSLFIRYNQKTSNVSDKGKIFFIADNSELFAVEVNGNTIPAENTLDIVSWNINWFGNPANGFGPKDDDLAEQNIKKTMNRLDADIYVFIEVVDVQRFRRMIQSLDGYGVSISDYCSNATDTLSSNYPSGQKIAYVFRKSLVESVQFRGLLRSSSTAYANWASGRLPYLMEAKIKNSSTFQGFQEPLYLIVLHGKAGDTEQDYLRRKAGAKELKDTLDQQFSKANVMIIGDYNDDLDETISKGTASRLSSYDDIVKDSIDSDRYLALSLPLSRAKYNSVIGYQDVVDHVMISNELENRYVKGSTQMLEEIVQWIPEYATTTSDHYPLLLRLNSSSVQTPTREFRKEEISFFKIMGNKIAEILHLEITANPHPIHIKIIQQDGKMVQQQTIYNTTEATISEKISLHHLASGHYFIHCKNGNREEVKGFVKY
ncbi:MAG: Ig-like domain-containing protein [Saprospiraceae bacterium]|nr:Ig-like domain-containing protein [Saprospiraceae bacterium]